MEGPAGGAPAPESAREALARARRHARNAAAEALAALRALLDAASLATTGAASGELRLLGALGRQLEEAETALRAGHAGGDALVAALADALDAEIARWQARSTEDPDARAVLRAFLGLRELLWELGVRPRAKGEAAEGEPRGASGSSGSRGGPASRPRAGRGAGEARPGPRVQRVPVEG